MTSCIHNILSGQRWIEHYGEIIIKNLNDDTCHCKLTFIKVTTAVTTAMLAMPFLTDISGWMLSAEAQYNCLQAVFSYSSAVITCDSLRNFNSEGTAAH